MKLSDEQQRLINFLTQNDGKVAMTTVNGLFHKNTINALLGKKLIEVPFMGGWYLLKLSSS